jgi:hypothetical protein
MIKAAAWCRAPFSLYPSSKSLLEWNRAPSRSLASYPLWPLASSPPRRESRLPPLLLPSLGELRRCPSSISSGPHLTPLIRFRVLQDVAEAAFSPPPLAVARSLGWAPATATMSGWWPPPPMLAPPPPLHLVRWRARARCATAVALREVTTRASAPDAPHRSGRSGHCADWLGRRPKAGPQCGLALCARGFNFFSFIFLEIHIKLKNV